MRRREAPNRCLAQNAEHSFFRWEGPHRGYTVRTCGPSLFSHSFHHLLEFPLETSGSHAAWSPQVLLKFLLLRGRSRAAEALRSERSEQGERAHAAGGGLCLPPWAAPRGGLCRLSVCPSVRAAYQRASVFSKPSLPELLSFHL